MKFTDRFVCLFGLVFVIAFSGNLPAQSPDDWSVWRGPHGNGISDGQNSPVNWNDSQNVVWKAEVPGRGHASPLIVGEQIFLATADEGAETQSLVCYDRTSGEKVWETLISEGGFPKEIHPNNTHASATPSCDGEHVFVVLYHHDQIDLTAVDLSGKIAWTQKVGAYEPMFPFGFAGSPVLYENLIIAVNESEKDSALVAFDRKTGKEVWRTERGSTSYSSPIVTNIGGRDQLIISGGQQVVAHDPSNGKKLWTVQAPWDVTCGTMVWDHDSGLVFASGGFPAQRTMAIRPEGDGEIVWENSVKCYEQSMLCHNGYLYGLSDRGVMYCWRASDGEEMWKQRLEEPVSASPVYAAGNIYISVESGKTFVFKANPEQFESVAENQLGTQAFATPSFVGDKIYVRVGQGSRGDYQEWLYCLGNE